MFQNLGHRSIEEARNFIDFLHLHVALTGKHTTDCRRVQLQMASHSTQGFFFAAQTVEKPVLVDYGVVLVHVVIGAIFTLTYQRLHRAPDG
ncbi:MAG: hypothetical protein COA78_33885 [Blastopirellula sp.]|nr:MAG: hypothetical protein COA78_33885 [Blastopirellula sp.]